MKVLAVCLGNICRSPLAHGILDHLNDKLDLGWQIDSAGTSAYHVGEAPCSGSIRVAQQSGINISLQQSRQVEEKDFEYFDLILAMDSSNYSDLLRMVPKNFDKNKIQLILNYSYPGENRSVPDSYYTGNYKEVFDLLSHACKEFVEQYRP